jgi:hypothetical protein
LNVSSEKLVSNFAFSKYNLHRYSEERAAAAAAAADARAAREESEAVKEDLEMVKGDSDALAGRAGYHFILDIEKMPPQNFSAGLNTETKYSLTKHDQSGESPLVVVCPLYSKHGSIDDSQYGGPCNN